MFDFDFPLLPHDSAAITVTTTVWVGVAVAVFFNLRLGWTLSALVVPGYLVPLLIARPTTGLVIYIEAIITYLIVRSISDVPRLKSFWCSFFGRDRFFLIVIVSVIVRAVCDGWVLPYAGRVALEQYDWNIDYRNNLQSFGLIVVALIANYFWKPGLVKGIGPLSICIAVTYFLVSFVLVGLTNFNVGNFHLIYEDISTSLMASPKAYIILITTAYLASWMNLRYAWDFNGILIPALLGLLWHDPLKIGISIAEAMLIFAIASLLLRLDFFKNKAIQGGRKLMFFFTVCFCFRLLAAHLLPLIFPNVAVSDALGLGYLLTTLMAIKAHDKNLSIRMLRGTLQVSALGAVVGSLLGFALICGPEIQFRLADANATSISREKENLKTSSRPISELVQNGKILLYKKRLPESYQRPTLAELNTFKSVLKKISNLNRDFDNAELNPIANTLASINYRLTNVSNQHLFLTEQEPVRGWGMYVITPSVADGLCLEVPAPLDEWATVEAAICIMQNLPTEALAIAGTPKNINLDGSSNVLQSKHTMFSVFHQVFGAKQPLQIRALTKAIANKRLTTHPTIDAGKQTNVKSQLWVSGKIPEALRLPRLKELLGSFDVSWGQPTTNNRLAGFCSAQLFMTRPDRRRLVGRSFITDHNHTETEFQTDLVHGRLHDWLNQAKQNICNQGTDGYVPATAEEMLYMDQEVLQPLFDALGSVEPGFLHPHSDVRSSRSPRPKWLNHRVTGHFQAISSTASVLGYQLTVISDPTTNDDYVILHEKGDQVIRGWGTFVFRPGLQEGFVVEVPRPLFESRSFEFGINLFERPRGAALLIAGAHPRANLDGSADISKAANRTNLFNLVRHVMLRHLGDRPMLISQARAIQAPVESDIVIASEEGASTLEQLSPLKRQMIRILHNDNLTTEFVNGSQETAGYELGLLMQAAAIQVSQNKEVLSLWLSPSLRTKFRQQSDESSLSAQFNACNIPTFDGSLADYVMQKHTLATSESDRGQETGPSENQHQVPDELRHQLTQYVQNYDVLKLFRVSQQFAQFHFTRILDEGSGQAFLAISPFESGTPTLLNLTGFVGNETTVVDQFDGNNINLFVRSRNLWMEVQSQ